ncbi:MAG: type IV pilus modification PilV family protein [Campylobacter sp.]|uniref:type IV pilus modification PilV family protein n=1 Tax=Campylobacter sp. TaxID=205 RepID=UPI003FA18A6E
MITRRGFSIIELILSIVVMGVVFLSIPTIVMQNSRNNTSAIIQQSVMDTKTRLALVLKAPWNCRGNPVSNIRTPIFGFTGAQTFYERNGIPPAYRRVYPNPSIARDTPCDPNEAVDIRHFDGEELSLKINTAGIVEGGGAGAAPQYTRDMIISATMQTSVNDRDMTGAADVDIKNITITTRAQTNPATTITLRAYSANIGDSPLIQTRTW